MERFPSGLSIIRSLSGSQRAREECFRALWRVLYPRLVVFVRLFDRRNAEEAEDLTQEIMEKIFKGIDSYKPGHGFSTWAFAIARNHCIDRGRRRRKEPETVPLHDSSGPSLIAHESAPERALLENETDARVAAFMETVDPGLRQIAFLRFHQHLGYREISRIMGAPVGTIKFRVFRFRRMLLSYLEGEKCQE